MPDNGWNHESVQQLSRDYQQFCVLAAAVKLDLFAALNRQEKTPAQLADLLRVDLRALTILLDALVALRLLDKHGHLYNVPESIATLLGGNGPGSILAIVKHSVVLAPRWLELDEVVRSGLPYTLRGDYTPPPGALEAFIEGMHNVASPTADAVVRDIPTHNVRKLLDVGGGPGTYTIAFLKANPKLQTVLFDRPQVLPIAHSHLAEAHMLNRAELIGGDFYADELPTGCDLAWVSAIIHMNSRRQNCDLFAKVARALNDDGRIVIRDHVMDESRTSPPSGAMFAINMLVSTEGGGTYTFDEIRQDLHDAGFIDVTLLRDRAEMNCLIEARKPPAKAISPGREQEKP